MGENNGLNTKHSTKKRQLDDTRDNNRQEAEWSRLAVLALGQVSCYKRGKTGNIFGAGPML